MSSASQYIVQTLWRYCNILRDDGLSYPDYVEQLTYLLFLKMAYEQRDCGDSRHVIPSAYNWSSLVSRRDKTELHRHYGRILSVLGGGSGMLGIIFEGAENKIRDPAKLSLLINDLIDKRNWSVLDTDVKGDAYEGLLEKNAQDTKSGAGQYFTPRPIIEAIIDVIGPKSGERICDPACGSCGFLLGAIEYIRKSKLELTDGEREDIRLNSVHGKELVPAVARLGAMNLYLHGIGPQGVEAVPPIAVGDSLLNDPRERYDVVVTNPPFGRRSSVTVLNEVDEERVRDLTVSRPDFWASTSNKQLNFLQHVNTILDTPGRAAIVVPDNVLFEEGAGEIVRRRLLDDCNVHTLLRLPSGIFYAGGVKANVLFFDKEDRGKEPATSAVWVYDLRTDVKVTLKSNPIRRSDLQEFVACCEAWNLERRRAGRSRGRETRRWRAFPYEEIVGRRACNWDITWDCGQREGGEELLSPAALASEIVDDLRMALVELESVAEEVKE